MPIENPEKVSVSVNKVRYFLKSTKIPIVLQPIPISSQSYTQGSATNALMASQGPSRPQPGLAIGPQTAASGPTFSVFQGSWNFQTAGTVSFQQVSSQRCFQPADT